MASHQSCEEHPFEPSRLHSQHVQSEPNPVNFAEPRQQQYALTDTKIETTRPTGSGAPAAEDYIEEARAGKEYGPETSHAISKLA